MSDEIIVGLISLAGVIISAVISWFIAQYKSQQEIKNQVSKTRQEILKDMLLPKRLEIYPELLKITQDIGKDNLEDKQRVRKIHEEAFDELKKWQMKHGGTLFMQVETYKAFKNLQNILKLDDLANDVVLDEAKIKSVWDKRNELRNYIKLELNILHYSEILLNEEHS